MSRITSLRKCRHVFVSGPPRSGTTLLQLILSAHPLITITPETIFIQKLFERKFLPNKELNQDETAFVMHLMRSDVKLNSWPAFDLHDFLKANSINQGMTVGQILDSLFVKYAEKICGGSQIVGNKKGLYASGYGPYTKIIFPDAKFLYIVRDPRDVSRSILENLSKRSLNEAAASCVNRDRHMAKMMGIFPDDVLVLRFEDLVSEPETVCRKMCYFLGVPFDERMLSFYRMNLDGARLIGVSKSIHRNTATPLNPDLIGQWKRNSYFSAKELQKIEGITRDYMKRYGYKPEAPFGGIKIEIIRLKILGELLLRSLRGKLTKSTELGKNT
ncbi:MAG: sulfotransferase [Candidatus Hodarchaeota archaeon]